MVSKNIVRQNAPKPEKYIIFFGSPVEEKNLHFNNFLTIFKTPVLQLIQIPKKFSFHSAKQPSVSTVTVVPMQLQ